MGSLKEHSRTAYTEDNITHEGVRTGALQRISRFANYIYNILAGKTPTIKYYVDAIAADAYACMDCGAITNAETAIRKKHSFGAEITHEIDHIVPVILGGGGCWLSNYQQICVTCHIKKSKRDKNERAVKIKQALSSHNPTLF
jgi:5-methylcytosine-specific restriction endonuclease McrA